MRLWLSSFVERTRASLFFIPVISVVVALGAAAASLVLDQQLSEDPSLPLGLTSTVESARAVLSTVAGATVTVAAIAFSVSLLLFQQASNQYSPRVIHSLFRDPFNKRVMGLVVGTFAFCLLVLRSVRAPLEDGGEAVIPHVSVLVAVVLGLASLLAIVAFIDHSAHAMDVSEILEDVARRTVDQIERDWEPAKPGSTSPDPPAVDHRGRPVRFVDTGWIQQIDVGAMLHAVPEGAVVRLRTRAGRYAIRGALLCTVDLGGERHIDDERLEHHLRGAVAIGDSRTMQQDVSFGLRQLVDVALKALSPGVNDPTTAQDAMFHAANVLGELLRRVPPEVVHHGDDGRMVTAGEEHTHESLIRLTYDEVRRVSSDQPTVSLYLLESLSLLAESVRSLDLDDRLPPLHEQADLILEGAESAGLLPPDLDTLRQAHQRRFGRS